MKNNALLSYYTSPGFMTDSPGHKDAISLLPNDIPSLVKIVQGLTIHQYVAEPFYNVTLDEARQDAESNIRRFDQMLKSILARKNSPLANRREPGERLIGVCHHFAVLLVGMLRAKGIPARCRYGFGDYFNPGFYEDHSLCEYWDETQERWILVDPQFDEKWQAELHISHNVLDVPRDHFLVAADAWSLCRNGEASADKFGIFKGEMRGLWFIAGNLVKDIAALNKMEMLQWDAWTGMPRPNNTMRDKKRLKFFDELAALTHDPDRHFDEIRKLYEDQERHLKVPNRVFNAMRRHLEYIEK